MKVLILGGSYFLGKHFVDLSENIHNLTVFNRGSRPLGLGGIREVVGDRQRLVDLQLLENESFDVVVDFCGYMPGDIQRIFQVLQGKIGQYIFISTVDVYTHGTGRLLSEDAPYENRSIPGEAGDYILGKIGLEQELKTCCGEYGATYTIFRPAFIYGPDNYAPREGIYFHWVEQAGQVLHPQDATGEFQFVYVKDVAKAILACIGAEAARNQAFNLANPHMETYDFFLDALKLCTGGSFDIIPVSVETILEKGIPLPFPLTREESNYYDGKKILTLLGEYTQLQQGLADTLAARRKK